MNSIYFITGTDTGVGKTLVSAALTVALYDRDPRTLFHKPFQTGVAPGQPDDTDWLLMYSRIPLSATMRPQYRFRLPASPHCAARSEQAVIDFEKTVKFIRHYAGQSGTMVVEGAGGLLVPIDAEHTMLDLIIALEARPVVVTRSSLGTLNHTALTWRELNRAGITPAALIVNDATPILPGEQTTVALDNLLELRRLAHPAPLFHIHYHARIDRDHLAAIGMNCLAAMEP
jgi:dethiobiotin synthetase